MNLDEQLKIKQDIKTKIQKGGNTKRKYTGLRRLPNNSNELDKLIRNKKNN